MFVCLFASNDSAGVVNVCLFVSNDSAGVVK